MRSIACCLIAAVVASTTVGERNSPVVGTDTASNEASARVPKNHTVGMLGDGTSYRFEPPNITVRQGDTVTYIMVSGGPHNVAFDATKISEAAVTALSEGMPDQVAALSGKFLMRPTETYVVSFAKVPAGVYEYYCIPHLAMEQRGKVTVVAK